MSFTIFHYIGTRAFRGASGRHITASFHSAGWHLCALTPGRRRHDEFLPPRRLPSRARRYIATRLYFWRAHARLLYFFLATSHITTHGHGHRQFDTRDIAHCARRYGTATIPRFAAARMMRCRHFVSTPMPKEGAMPASSAAVSHASARAGITALLRMRHADADAALASASVRKTPRGRLACAYSATMPRFISRWAPLLSTLATLMRALALVAQPARFSPRALQRSARHDDDISVERRRATKLPARRSACSAQVG